MPLAIQIQQNFRNDLVTYVSFIIFAGKFVIRNS